MQVEEETETQADNLDLPGEPEEAEADLDNEQVNPEESLEPGADDPTDLESFESLSFQSVPEEDMRAVMRSIQACLIKE